MAHDILTALALVLIIEGLLPFLAPHTWLRMMRDVARLGLRGVRLIGVVCLLSGAIMLNFLH